MKDISEYFGEDLFLIQPSFFKREFELRSLNELIAKMSFPKFFSTNAVIDGLEEKYEIKQPSIWKSEIDIHKQGREMPFAKYTSNFWRTRGTIELPRGAKLNFKFGVFKKALEVSSSSSDLLVLFRNKISFKEKTIVSIEQKSEVIDENPWVIMLGFYVILQNKRGSAAAAG